MKYLGHKIISRDSDALALFMNLTKAQCSQISNLIATEGADPAIGGKIYVAVVFLVIPYGLETWVWILSMLTSIRRFNPCTC